jgi:hypothetical protein
MKLYGARLATAAMLMTALCGGELLGQTRQEMTDQFADAPGLQVLVPLTELGSGENYKSMTGGLYGEGRNAPPAEHLKAALAAAQQVVPLDRDGRPAADGRIVLMSVGMSNTTQEFSAFMTLAAADGTLSPQLVLVDAAQGGLDAHAWADPANRRRQDRPDPWEVVNQRLEAAGVTPQQVQVVWIKQALAGPARLGEFPVHVRALEQHLLTTIARLKQTLPNLRIIYLSSRTYAGFATTPLNPEPYAYEGAFSVRWLIERQIAGDAALNHDPQRGQVRAPVLLWGPYLWAAGEQPRKADGFHYTRQDFANDGTHPSDSGRRKVGELLLNLLKTDATARPWAVAAPNPVAR